MDEAVVHILGIHAEITSGSLKSAWSLDVGDRGLTTARCNSTIPGTLDIRPRIRSCFGFLASSPV